MELEFFASCIGGLERVLADELKTFGIERVRPLGGGVAFFCDPAGAYRACLWSRIASRVLLVIERVGADDADALYEGVSEIAWEEIIRDGSALSVRASGTNDNLRNTKFTALKVKDAIVDRLRERRGAQRSYRGDALRAAIDVRVRASRATISFDFSGEALNHRPYLTDDDKKDAPLECSLAAGALALGMWNDDAWRGASLVDPACRDGILIVEAGGWACDLAPSLDRKKWGFEAWSSYDEAAWRALVEEARDRFEEGASRMTGSGHSTRADHSVAPIVGTATSSPLVARAREHVRRAGLKGIVSVEYGDASGAADVVARAAFAARRGGASRGMASLMVASCIDARSRSDAQAYVQADEIGFAAACTAAARAAMGSDAPAPFRFVAVSPEDVRTRLGIEPSVEATVGKGRIEARIEVYDTAPTGCPSIEIYDLEGGASHTVEVLETSSDQFAARLRKVFKERRRWAKREGVTCYRIYDSDLPDYAVAIDWYSGAANKRGNCYLHISEYGAPASIDPDRARRRFADVLAIAPVVCGVRPDHVFSKRRIRDKGGAQYRNAGSRAYVTTVEEGGFDFEVDLAGRLDTGLFLDHRITRGLIASLARGKRFLNLFAYTGTASVYAAGGGARSTVTVDLSQTYIEWARRNMAENGFTGRGHEFVKADVLRWITEARRGKRRFDLIFVDPPTFSNSKAMGKKTWDVQRDHAELLIGVAHLLDEGGQAVFSCNLRTFKPDVEKLERYGVEVEDISEQTIPYDFARTPKVHKCYLVRRASRRTHVEGGSHG